MEQDNSEEIIGFQERENNLKLKVMQAEEQLAISANSKDLMRSVQWYACSTAKLLLL